MRNYSLSVKISGITCEACIRLIKKKVRRINGVTDVAIKNNDGETMIISNSVLKVSDIVTALSGMPYTVLGA